MYLNICFTHVKYMLNICGLKHVSNTCGQFSCVPQVKVLIYIYSLHIITDLSKDKFICMLNHRYPLVPCEWQFSKPSSGTQETAESNRKKLKTSVLYNLIYGQCPTYKRTVVLDQTKCLRQFNLGTFGELIKSNM